MILDIWVPYATTWRNPKTQSTFPDSNVSWVNVGPTLGWQCRCWANLHSCLGSTPEDMVVKDNSDSTVVVIQKGLRFAWVIGLAPPGWHPYMRKIPGRRILYHRSKNGLITIKSPKGISDQWKLVDDTSFILMPPATTRVGDLGNRAFKGLGQSG